MAQQYPDLAYPNTDAQYTAPVAVPQLQQSAQTVEIPDGQGGAKTVDVASAEYAAYYADYCEKYYAQQSVLSRYGIDLTAYGDEEGQPVATEATTSSSSSAAAPASEQSEPANDLAATAADEEEEEEEEAAADEWVKHTDEATGASYYFNEATGESSWTEPSKT